MNAIETFGLTKSYGRRRGIVDVTLTVAEGEVFGFLGPNGAGKTTTIRTLVGLLRPTSGHATVFGLDAWAAAPEVHRRLSYLGSDPGYLGELTAAEQLDYLARLRGLARAAWRPLAERFELDPTVRIRRLSRGNRQKVGVVQAFMGEEPLLMLDEPTSGLDPLMQREFLALLTEVRAAGRTIFLSSHNLPEVERSCDRVGIIRDGRIVDMTSVSDLVASHWRSVSLVLAQPAPRGIFDLPNVRVVDATARDVHLMVQGEVNPLLGRIAQLDVTDISIETLEVEDLFLRFYGPPAEAPGDDDGAGLVAAAAGSREEADR
jgi:ABC-2 type transport system ATP-binding protein